MVALQRLGFVNLLLRAWRQRRMRAARDYFAKVKRQSGFWICSF
jgi:hypothetical protein